MKHIRIKLLANESRLEYLNPKTGIYEIATIKGFDTDAPTWSTRHYQSGIKYAYKILRTAISMQRCNLKGTDKLAEKGSNSILSLLRDKRKYKAREAFTSKKPVTKHKHVGVEIEFISSSSRNDIAADLATLNLTRFVELKNDGSVHDDSSDGDCNGDCREDCECAYCGEEHICDNKEECDERFRMWESSRRPNTYWEIKDDCDLCIETEYLDGCDCGGLESDGETPICKGEHVVCQGHCKGHSCLGYEDHNNYDCQCECNCGNDNGHEIAIVAKSSEIKDVIKKVCGVLTKHNSKVNSTCGLHVHLDARGHDQNKMFSNLVKSQRLLYSMVPKSRYENTYCSPNKYKDMNKYHTRYWGINPMAYNSHKTIEVRLHSGTINAKKINNWINLLQKIAYRNKGINLIKTLSDLPKQVILSVDLLEYISERVNCFTKGRGYPDFVNDLELPKTKEVKPEYQDSEEVA